MPPIEDDALMLNRAARVLSALSDPERLIALGGVVRHTTAAHGVSIRELAEHTGRAPAQTARAVAVLAEAGLVTVRRDQVDHAGGDLPGLAEALVALMPISGLLNADPELARYFRHGRLTALPVMTKTNDRRRLAAVLVRLLEEGRSYTEPEVNAVLRTVLDDHAALRRFLVEEGQLERQAGRDYRRVMRE